MICDLRPVKNHYKFNVKGGNQTHCNVFKGQSSLSPSKLTISIFFYYLRDFHKNPVFAKGRQTGANRCSSLENTTQYFRSKRLNDIYKFYNSPEEKYRKYVM